MRIGIITQPMGTNYGGILQNYALQQVLKELGHNPITLDHYIKYPLWRFILSRTLYYISTLIPYYKRSYNRRPYKGRITTLCVHKFIKNYILRTKNIHIFNPNIIKKYNLEALIVGSDQVWRPSYNEHIEDMFLKFAQNNKKITKVAYAASFGNSEWDFTEEQTLKCRDLIKSFSKVSVRELSGISLCRQFLNIDASLTLDPTLLIDKSYYESLCQAIPKRTTEFIACYILDMTPDKKEYIKRLQEETKLPIIYFSAHENMKLSIEEWISTFRDAKFVYTDSFHGTIFSIIFKTNFFVFLNKIRGSDRFITLLSQLNIENRIIYDYTNFDLNQEIDWNSVHEKINKNKIDSILFLENSIYA